MSKMNFNFNEYVKTIINLLGMLNAE